MRSTKKSIIASGISLAVSVALLAGSTFAWFTDSVTNKGNKIQAGKLDVELWQKTESLSDAQKAEGLPYELEYTNISASTVPIFGYGRWEPGYSEGAALQVRNKGTLALKYELAFTGFEVKTGAENDGTAEQDGNIAEVLDVYLLDTYRAPTNADIPAGTVAEFMTDPVVDTGVLASGVNSSDINVIVKMRDTAGNEYQNALVEFDVELRATQAADETDGFGNSSYDSNATGAPDNEDWDIGGQDTKTVEGGTDTVMNVRGATVTVPANTVASGTELTLKVVKTEKPDEVTIQYGQTAKAYEITLEGLPEDNTTAISVELNIGAGLENVKLYHKGTLLTEQEDNFAYNAVTGIVSFTTTSFSPFTIVWGEAKGIIVNNEEELREAVSKNGTVYLGSDFQINNMVAINNAEIILDLNGHNITVPAPVDNRSIYAIENNGILTIRDTSENADGSINSRGVQNLSGATMYMQGGTVRCVDSNGGGAAVWNEGTFYMTGGKLEFTGTKTPENNVGSPLTNQNGTVTVTGGQLVSPYTCYFGQGDSTTVIKDITLESETDYFMTVKFVGNAVGTLENVTINTKNGGCIENAGGKVTLKNCNFTQTVVGNPQWNSCAVATSNYAETIIESGTYAGAVAAVYNYNSSGRVTINGGTFLNGLSDNGVVLKIDNPANIMTSYINVNGGNFTGTYSIGNNNANLTLYGGTFSMEPDERYLADGYTAIQNGNVWEVAAK